VNEATRIAAFEDAVGCILHYHQRTKHHLHQYARSAGYLDWANQPDPFRTFAGAPRIDLPLGDVATPYDDLYRPGAVPSRPPILAAWASFSSSPWACPPGNTTRIHAGRCAATRPAATCTRPRVTPSFWHCRALKPGSITTSAGTTALSAAAPFPALRQRSWPGYFPKGRFLSGRQDLNSDAAVGAPAPCASTPTTPSPLPHARPSSGSRGLGSGR